MGSLPLAFLFKIYIDPGVRVFAVSGTSIRFSEQRKLGAESESGCQWGQIYKVGLPQDLLTFALATSLFLRSLKMKTILSFNGIRHKLCFFNNQIFETDKT